MRRNVSLFSASILMIISVLYISGITFSRPESTDNEKDDIEIIYKVDEKASKLLEKVPRQESAVVANNSGKNLFVRLKIEVPKSQGEKLILLGRMNKDKFVASSFSSAEKESAEQFWEKKGDYIYYKNSKTNDILKAGSISTEIYESVMLSEKAPEGTENSIIILAEYSETPWAEGS